MVTMVTGSLYKRSRNVSSVVQATVREILPSNKKVDVKVLIFLAQLVSDCVYVSDNFIRN